jgi:hypothetical protein
MILLIVIFGDFYWPFVFWWMFLITILTYQAMRKKSGFQSQAGRTRKIKKDLGIDTDFRY